MSSYVDDGFDFSENAGKVMQESALTATVNGASAGGGAGGASASAAFADDDFDFDAI